MKARQLSLCVVLALGLLLILGQVNAQADAAEPITLANHDQIQLLDVFALGGSAGILSEGFVQVSADSNRLFGENNSHQKNVPNTRVYSIWDLRTLSQIADEQYNLSYGYAPIAAASSDGRLVVYSIHDQQQYYFAVWDVEKQADVFQTTSVTNVAEPRVSFSPDDRFMATGFLNANTQIWDLQAQSVRFEVPEGRWFFSADSQSVVVIDNDVVRVYDTAMGYVLKNVRFTPLENIRAMHLSDDASSLVLINDESFEYIDLEKETIILFNTEYWMGYLAADRFDFSADNTTLLLIVQGSQLYRIDLHDGHQLAFWPLRNFSSAVFSPDGHFIVTSHPFQFIDLSDGKIIDLPGEYVGTEIHFSKDATSLIISDDFSSMVFGIPNAQRLAWQPVIGHVPSSGVSLRPIPDRNVAPIGYAKGAVQVGGRAINTPGDAVYLSELGGWIRADKIYLKLDTPFDRLPIVNSYPK